MNQIDENWSSIEGDQSLPFAKLRVQYYSAMMQIIARIESLDQQLALSCARNPIHHIEKRIKSFHSISEKLAKQNRSVTIETIRANVLDVAGIRIVCSYVEDIYRVADMLKLQDDLQLIQIKDYIETPKPSGYRSYHMTVGAAVYGIDGKQMIPVEIQMRTIAMDFWASLEHQLKYKTNAMVSSSMRERLHSVAETIWFTDVEMQSIYMDINAIR
ncbi:MAG: GTP pyrophosphokinase family protein [Clostridia bacterium]|nr:GTP pyrophosphokinase family protein [Clostridia bacterium]MBR1710415.1 GTP pyrophosphokinase family protein [Clostridia bacterium]